MIPEQNGGAPAKTTVLVKSSDLTSLGKLIIFNLKMTSLDLDWENGESEDGGGGFHGGGFQQDGHQWKNEDFGVQTSQISAKLFSC